MKFRESPRSAVLAWRKVIQSTQPEVLGFDAKSQVQHVKQSNVWLLVYNGLHEIS
ncbi:hypothetical protein IFVP177_C1210014 [Vibrio parahaemolyticus]